MADGYIYHDSTLPQDNEFLFSNRQYVWVPDSNGGTYGTSQVIFDLASLSNSGKIFCAKDSFLSIPLVLHGNLSVATTNAAENVFALSLKSMPALVHSLSVEITNSSVTNLANFSNLDINYKMLSTASQSWHDTMGPSIGFQKDSVSGLDIQGLNGNLGTNATTFTATETNNYIHSQTFTPSAGFAGSDALQNKGRLARQSQTSFDPSQFPQCIPAGSVDATMQQCGKNYCVKTTTDIVHYVQANIPLACLHDLFEKLPLCKGIYIRLIVNLNTNCRLTATLHAPTAGAIAVPTVPTAAAIRTPTGVGALNTAQAAATASTEGWFDGVQVSTYNGTLPFMVSPISQHNAYVPTEGGVLYFPNPMPRTSRGFTINADTNLTVTLNIGRSSQNAAYQSGVQQCRIYACCYEFTPQFESEFFAAIPQKRILYEDRNNVFTIPGIQPGQPFSTIVTNGVSRPRYLLIQPKVNTTSNGNLDPFTSPFTSSPCTCAPFGGLIKDFNVLVSGVAIYQQNYNYRWESFLHEFAQKNSLNGKMDMALTSGLISQTEWEQGYGFVVVDLSRRVDQASDNISRSIQVIGTNGSAYVCDLLVTVVYERELQISTTTGTLIA